ncbi:hypothetical protein, partial [Streptococcus anginosus]|uniref:hypothetical protein n=1 Tax=Streptococcus anginosus TaxID=1328 RepID=UPI002ED9EB2C
IPGRGFYAQISSEITSEFPGVTLLVPIITVVSLDMSSTSFRSPFKTTIALSYPSFDLQAALTTPKASIIIMLDL